MCNYINCSNFAGFRGVFFIDEVTIIGIDKNGEKILHLKTRNNIQMKKLYSIILGFIIFNISLNAQTPSVLGTSIVDGTYRSYDLTDLCAFRQASGIQATTSAGSGTRTWEFMEGTAAAPSYTNNWRPYTSGLTLAGYNQFIAPVGGTASALYNSGSGGQSGLLPAVTAGRYYTFNITEVAGPTNQRMAVLETTYLPVKITSLTQPAMASCKGYTVDIGFNNPINYGAGENVYIRYTIDNFTNSSIVQGGILGVCGTITIPPLPKGTVVTFYAFTSNMSLSQINSSVATNGQSAYDMLTLSLINANCANYTYTVPTAMPTASISAAPGATVCTGQSVVLTGVGSGGTAFTSPRYPYNISWSKSPSTSVISQSQSYCINPVDGTSSGTYIVTVTDMLGCTMTSSVVVAVSASATAVTAPTSITTDRNNFCVNDSGNISLTVTGGTGDSIIIYKGSCDTIKGTVIARLPIATRTFSLASPDVTTSYFAQTKNICGVVSSCVSVQVVTKPLPLVTINKEDDTCHPKTPNDGSINVTANPASTTFSWMPTSVLPSATSPNLKCLAPGTYTLTATSNGCTSTYSITIN